MISTVVAVVVPLILVSGFRIAREYERAVVFRLGRYTGLRGPACSG
jgi:regulator of protease activity HflC (stomatin/prohibitin superfamily)